MSGNHGGSRKFARKNIDHGRVKDMPKLKLDADGNLEGATIKCATAKPRIPLEALAKAVTGKPRLPRAPRDTSLEDAFALQIAEALRGYPPHDPIRKWETQYFFAKPRMWRFDLAFPAPKIAVEIDGGTWINGAHNRGVGIENDYEKRNTAESMGWHVLQLTAAQVHDGRGIEWLMKLIKLSVTTHTPISICLKESLLSFLFCDSDLGFGECITS